MVADAGPGGVSWSAGGAERRSQGVWNPARGWGVGEVPRRVWAGGGTRPGRRGTSGGVAEVQTRRRCGGREEGCGRAGLWCKECRRRGRRVCARRGVGSSGDRPPGAGGGGDGRPAGRGESGGCAGRRRLRGGARGPVQDGALGAGLESAGPLRRSRGLCTVPSLPCRPLPGVGLGPARRGMRVRPAHLPHARFSWQSGVNALQFTLVGGAETRPHDL